MEFLLFLPVNLSISDGQKIDAHSPAYVYVAGEDMNFLSFFGRQKIKTRFGKSLIYGESMNLRCISYLGRVWVFFNCLHKRPTRLLQDESKKLAKFKTVLNLYGNENSNSKLLQEFRGKKKEHM